MKILITANSAWYISNFRSNLITKLITDGHEVSILAPHDESVEDLLKLGCQYKDLKMDKKGTSPLRDFFLVVRFYFFFRELRPDCVLSYTVKNNIYGSLAASILKIPILPNVSGLGTAFAEGGWLNKVVTHLSKLAFSKLPKVIFQNEEDKQLFIKKKILNESQTLRVLGSGVDLDHFSYSPLPGEEQVVFLLLARMIWHKGVGQFVGATQLLIQEGYEINSRLLGFVDVENKNAISREQIIKWQNDGIIHYVGSTKDVRPYIEAADCVVLPSYYREGVPRSLLEAAAMGRPIITSDSVGCRDTVDNSVSGFLCLPKDISSLASQMRKFVLMSYDERQKMGNASRMKAEKEFSEKNVVGAYLTWIDAQQKNKSMGRIQRADLRLDFGDE